MASSVFYSFHYTRDVNRIQLVRNFDALEGQPILNAQEWEEVQEQGPAAIEKWIKDQMAYKKAVIVLIGQETANRPWVQYEVDKAWADKKPLLGIRIHGLASFGGGADMPGPNPFDRLDGGYLVPVFDPTVKEWTGSIDTKATYNTLHDSIVSWSTQGVTRS
ncbi:TIR domain-containing protein [Kineococcus sp. TBRC 1896]|uniref:TIR domain-containing protein n=1 Tax=Kineococcus mangrovi TaxID=1660183 RepID=A0ABV4I1H3_9ACTN